MIPISKNHQDRLLNQYNEIPLPDLEDQFLKPSCLRLIDYSRTRTAQNPHILPLTRKSLPSCLVGTKILLSSQDPKPNIYKEFDSPKTIHSSTQLPKMCTVTRAFFACGHHRDSIGYCKYRDTRCRTTPFAVKTDAVRWDCGACRREREWARREGRMGGGRR